MNSLSQADDDDDRDEVTGRVRRLEHQAERAELMLLTRPVRLHDLVALAVADAAGELVPRFLDGQLPVHLPP